MSKLAPISVHDLGGYLREQRQAAQLSLRQLSEVAGVSNPYLSQIERGLKRPSAEILQQLAKGLRISAESLYVRAGILEEQADHGDSPVVDVRAAVLADRRLTDRQRSVLLDVYESFVGDGATGAATDAAETPPARTAPARSRSTKTPSTPPAPADRSRPRQPPPRQGDRHDPRHRHPQDRHRQHAPSTSPSASPTSPSRRCATPASAPPPPARLLVATRRLPARVAGQAQQVPTLAFNRTLEIAGQAQESYDDLAERGEKLVKRLRSQKATQDLIAQAEHHRPPRQGAVTTARKAAAETQRAARATRDHRSPRGRRRRRDRRRVGAGRGGHQRQGRAQVGRRHPHPGQAHDHDRPQARRLHRARHQGHATSARKTAPTAAKATKAAATKVGD